MMYYFGCWRDIGHFLYTPTGKDAHDVRRSLPWENIDSGLCPGTRDRFGDVPVGEQIEGRALLHHKFGWTALAWWDRSVDGRYGSNSAFIFEGTLTADEMLDVGAKTFPHVHARLTFPIVVES